MKVSEAYKGPIHLMLTDIVMPEMNGYKLANRLKLYRPDIKVVYMSGYTDKTIVDRGVLVREANFIEKPFTPESLIRKIREVLDSPRDKQGR